MAEPAGRTAVPLIKTLGYTSGDIVYAQGAPDWFCALLHKSNIITPEDLLYFDRYIPAEEKPAYSEKLWLHGFFTSTADIDELDFLNTAYYSAWDWDAIWVSWPKKSAQKTLPDDLDEQHFRDILLPLGWAGTKVCAIDGTWNGLKFIQRRLTAPKD